MNSRVKPKRLKRVRNLALDWLDGRFTTVARFHITEHSQTSNSSSSIAFRMLPHRRIDHQVSRCEGTYGILSFLVLKGKWRQCGGSGTCR